MLKFNDHLAQTFIKPHEYQAMEAQLSAARLQLDGGQGPAFDFGGWLDLPERMDAKALRPIQEAADRIRRDFDYLILVGIGGSYLGARAVIEALSHHFNPLLARGERGPLVLYAGHQLSPSYLSDLIEVTRGKEVALNVISKSGTTTEPAVAFRILRQELLGHLSDREMADRVWITSDADSGALRQMARDHGYPSFEIPRDIGGRYSVLTPVGLLPMAVAGIDLEGLLQGAREERLRSLAPLKDGWSPADRYAVDRILLNRKGFHSEIMAAFEPSLHYVTEWWKQLFGESEGKDGRGIIPMGVDFTSDLHSLGQLIQEGPRVFFETVIQVRETVKDLLIPSDPADPDQLEYLAGKALSLVNREAARGTALAHTRGGVPNLSILLEEKTARALGGLIYFFERACALSAFMNGVNPFDQPGVEAYKQAMFSLLGKPGSRPLEEQDQS